MAKASNPQKGEDHFQEYEKPSLQENDVGEDPREETEAQSYGGSQTEDR